MRRKTKGIGGVLLVAVLLVAIGYAAIAKIGLNIDGTAKSKADQSNFVVEMIGTPTTSGDGTIVATINESKRTEGTMNVSGLTAKGETAIAVYTVKNKSQDLSADLTVNATSTNEEYFEVISNLDKTTLKAEEETTLTVTVKLLKTPIDETKEDLSTNIGVSINAEPKQPGEENGGSSGETTESTSAVTGTLKLEGKQISLDANSWEDEIVLNDENVEYIRTPWDAYDDEEYGYDAGMNSIPKEFIPVSTTAQENEGIGLTGLKMYRGEYGTRKTVIKKYKKY